MPTKKTKYRITIDLTVKGTPFEQDDWQALSEEFEASLQGAAQMVGNKISKVKMRVDVSS